MKKLLILLFFISLSASAATFLERVNAAFSKGEDSEKYLKLCGVDPREFKKQKDKLVKDLNETLLACMESKVSEVAQEKADKENKISLIQADQVWIRTIDCETLYNKTGDKWTDAEKVLRAFCRFYQR